MVPAIAICPADRVTFVVGAVRVKSMIHSTSWITFAISTTYTFPPMLTVGKYAFRAF